MSKILQHSGLRRARTRSVSNTWVRRAMSGNDPMTELVKRIPREKRVGAWRQIESLYQNFSPAKIRELRSHLEIPETSSGQTPQELEALGIEMSGWEVDAYDSLNMQGRRSLFLLSAMDIYPRQLHKVLTGSAALFQEGMSTRSDILELVRLFFEADVDNFESYFRDDYQGLLLSDFPSNARGFLNEMLYLAYFLNQPGAAGYNVKVEERFQMDLVHIPRPVVEFLHEEVIPHLEDYDNIFEAEARSYSADLYVVPKKETHRGRIVEIKSKRTGYYSLGSKRRRARFIMQAVRLATVVKSNSYLEGLEYTFSAEGVQSQVLEDLCYILDSMNVPYLIRVVNLNDEEPSEQILHSSGLMPLGGVKDSRPAQEIGEVKKEKIVDWNQDVKTMLKTLFSASNFKSCQNIEDSIRKIIDDTRYPELVRVFARVEEEFDRCGLPAKLKKKLGKQIARSKELILGKNSNTLSKTDAVQLVQIAAALTGQIKDVKAVNHTYTDDQIEMWSQNRAMLEAWITSEFDAWCELFEDLDRSVGSNKIHSQRKLEDFRDEALVMLFDKFYISMSVFGLPEDDMSLTDVFEFLTETVDDVEWSESLIQNLESYSEKIEPLLNELNKRLSERNGEGVLAVEDGGVVRSW